jgi:hypothetical protein
MTDYLSTKRFYINYVQILKLELWNISNVIRISLMQVTVPLWMMTWSNTLVYSCECVLFCFTAFSCECIFLCVLSCLMFIVISTFRSNWCRDWISGMNSKYVCMCLGNTSTSVRTLSLEIWVCGKLFQQRCSLPHFGIHLHHYQPKHGLRSN